MIKLTRLVNNSGWGTELLLNINHIQAVMQAPRNPEDSTPTCTRIIMSGEDYYDVEESVNAVFSKVYQEKATFNALPR